MNAARVWMILGLFAGLTTACERLEPAPENDVRFQAVGRVTTGTGVERQQTDAVLIIREVKGGAYVLETRNALTLELLFQGRMGAGSLDVRGLRGPLQTQ